MQDVRATSPKEKEPTGGKYPQFHLSQRKTDTEEVHLYFLTNSEPSCSIIMDIDLQMIEDKKSPAHQMDSSRDTSQSVERRESIYPVYSKLQKLKGLRSHK